MINKRAVAYIILLVPFTVEMVLNSLDCYITELCLSMKLGAEGVPKALWLMELFGRPATYAFTFAVLISSYSCLFVAYYLVQSCVIDYLTETKRSVKVIITVEIVILVVFVIAEFGYILQSLGAVLENTAVLKELLHHG